MKFVRHETKGFFLFPKSDLVWHSAVGRFLGNSKILSAGFVSFGSDGPACYGASESLGIGSREDDTESLRREMGLVV